MKFASPTGSVISASVEEPAAAGRTERVATRPAMRPAERSFLLMMGRPTFESIDLRVAFISFSLQIADFR
jgi:hypothetical protein